MPCRRARSASATPASTRIPLEKASRWPRRVSCRGRKRSLGDEARQVREPVEARVARRCRGSAWWPAGPRRSRVPDRARAEDGLDLLGDHGRRAVGVGHGVGPPGQQRDAEHEEAQRRCSWRRASGGRCATRARRKLLTPLEIASSPVSDEPPLAKERSREMKASPINQPEPGVPILPPKTWSAGGSGI